MQQPSIFPLGLRIDEPVTVLTDLIVAAVCFFAFVKLKSNQCKNLINYFLKLYFFTMGIATFLGGVVGHGFLYFFDGLFELNFVISPWKLPGWIVSMFSITLLERAMIEYTDPIINPLIGKILKWVNILEFILFLFIVFYTLNFWYVQVHAAYGLLFVVTSLNIYILIKRNSKSSKTFLIAVAYSAIGALVYMNKWSLSQWFNHYDISHVFLALSAYWFYLGSGQLQKDKLFN